MNASPLSSSRQSLRSTLAPIAAMLCVAMLMLVLVGVASSKHTEQFSSHPVAWAQDDGAETETDAQVEPTIDIPQTVEPTQSQAQAQYFARVVEPSASGFDPLGDLDDLDQRSVLTFTQMGAGVESLKLADEFETVAFEKHVLLQKTTSTEHSSSPAVPFTALYVQINDEIVYIIGSEEAPVWAQVSQGVFEAYIDDAQGQPVLRVVRSYTLKPNQQHGFYLKETIENLTDAPLRARLVTIGAIDMPKAISSYGGDRRRIRYGHLLTQEQQGTSLKVQVDEELKNRSKLLGKKVAGEYGKSYPTNLTVWPNEELLPGSTRLSWLAFTDRYFIVAMHPHFDAATVTSADEKLLNNYDLIDRLVLNPYDSALDAVQALRLTGKEYEIAPSESVSTTLGVYAGPRNRPLMNAEPEIASLNMPELVVANLGGICAPCTFSWLTDILIGVLRTFHSIVGDWAVSILLLVVLVRGCLHPVTRWSQIRVQRFSVQMQAMAPKQKAIREKYKDDSKKQQAEMGKLWREEGISPAGMLGCLPMFLQSPVWIALYATLFFASELRHEPAFYGVFQNALNWQFMNDLSAPDGAIPLPASMHFSFAMWGSVDSINILPLLLGVVFFLHQKYLTPPTQATLTPEQESQQKMMKVMMVFLFPVMMYAAPSGLALYFITNSGMGIIENKWIRAHMKKHGMLEIENIRAQKKDKGPGFLQRMTEAAEAQKQLKEKGPAQPNPASKNSRRGKL